MVSKNVGTGVIVLSVLAVLAGCVGSGSLNGVGRPGAGATATKSLYDRLGGKPAITAVVDQFVANVAADGGLIAALLRRTSLS